MGNIIKSKYYVIYLKNFFYRILKIKFRTYREMFYSDISTLLFFFFEFLLLRLLNLFRSGAKTIEKPNDNSSVDELQAVNKEFDLNFLLLTVKVSLFIFIIGILIFGVFRYFVYLSQNIILQQEDIKTKLLLGATPNYVSFEIIVEALFGIPAFLIIGYLFSGVFTKRFVFLLYEMFPVGNLFKDGIQIFNIETMFMIVLGMIIINVISMYHVKKKLLRIIN